MEHTNTWMKTTLQVALLALLTTLAGCGGGDDPEPKLCLVLFVIPVPCSAGTPSSPPPPTQTPPPATTPPPSTGSSGETETSGGTASGSSGRTAVVNHVNEFEPNNTLDNANVVQFPTAPLDSSVVLDIIGSVQETDDPADFFIFTPDRSDTHGIYLCAETCDELVEDDAVYIMLYDQNQTTIASTPVGTVSEQLLVAELTAGLAYYVEVHGYNTGPVAYDYQLVIID